jgi:PIN domain nuclease of toxin-antitoxin system
MRLLLDTNALLWQLGVVGNKRLGKRAKQLMAEADAVCVSAVSILEMQIKTMNGKLNAPADSVQMVVDAGNVVIGFPPAAADAIRRFTTLHHHDPFDRMLLAQATADDMTLLTADKTLLSLGLPHVVDATV